MLEGSDCNPNSYNIKMLASAVPKLVTTRSHQCALLQPPLEKVLMPFRPGFDYDLMIVPVIISLCFVVAVVGWLHAAHVKADSDGKVPNYVLYLTQSYKPECSGWEIERLVRKMLLSLTTQVLPVTYSPASQMQLVSVILLAALLLHTRFKPYKNESWNTIEVGIEQVGPFQDSRKFTRNKVCQAICGAPL